MATVRLVPRFTFNLSDTPHTTLLDEVNHFRQVVVRDGFLKTIESLQQPIHDFDIDNGDDDIGLPYFHVVPSSNGGSSVVFVTYEPEDDAIVSIDIHNDVRRLFHMLSGMQVLIKAGYYVGFTAEFELDEPKEKFLKVTLLAPSTDLVRADPTGS